MVVRGYFLPANNRIKGWDSFNNESENTIYTRIHNTKTWRPYRWDWNMAPQSEDITRKKRDIIRNIVLDCEVEENKIPID